MDKFHIRLKECREKKKNLDSKWTQGYVAKKTGVARSTYTAYENGTKQPPLETVSKIADVFDVTTDFLLGKTDVPNTNDINRDKSYYISKIATEFPNVDLMFKDMESLSAEEWEDVYEYVKFRLSQKENKE